MNGTVTCLLTFTPSGQFSGGFSNSVACLVLHVGCFLIVPGMFA